jgi:hypothetical protein
MQKFEYQYDKNRKAMTDVKVLPNGDRVFHPYPESTGICFPKQNWSDESFERVHNELRTSYNDWFYEGARQALENPETLRKVLVELGVIEEESNEATDEDEIEIDENDFWTEDSQEFSAEDNNGFWSHVDYNELKEANDDFFDDLRDFYGDGYEGFLDSWNLD